MKKAIFDIEWARMCMPCAYEMEQVYLVRFRGNPVKGKCERCGKEGLIFRYQYTMKGSELIRRGYAEPPEWMKEKADGAHSVT